MERALIAVCLLVAALELGWAGCSGKAEAPADSGKAEAPADSGSTCSGHGSATSGACLCSPGYTGTACDRCAPGYVGFPACVASSCSPDPCNGHGSCASGNCICKTGYNGALCDSCAPGYIGYPSCVDDRCDPDPCNAHGTCSGGACTCSTGYGGVACNACAAGYSGYPNCAQTNTQTSLRADGTILMGGKPVFPMGFWSDGQSSLGLYNAEADALGQAGLTTQVAINDDLSAADLTSFVTHANAVGVTPIVGAYHGDVMPTVQLLKSQPNILAWLLSDDADALGPAEVTKRNTAVKAADPTRLTSVSVPNLGPPYDQWTALADVTAVQWYPISSTGVEWTFSLCDSLMVSARKFQHTGMISAQTFAWPKDRFPSSAEVDVMTYLCVQAGIRGILYYTFHDYASSSSLPISQLALWSAVTQATSEIKSLEPAILNGQRVATGTAADQQFSAYWIYQSKVYVIVVNASTSAGHTVSVSLPANTAAPAQPMFSYRKHTLALTGTKLVGDMAPLDVQIYVAPLAP